MSTAPETRRAVGLTVAAVARRLGVAPATLRTWDRRYGLGPSQRSEGSHRRYTEDDVARLERMRRLMVGGLSPADAAHQVCNGEPDDDVAVVERTSSVAPRGRAGGGQVIPMPDGTPAARGLARAAASLDADACAAIVSEAISRRGVVWTWETLVSPVLVGIGRKWESTGQGIEVEHVLSDALHGVLTAVMTARRPGTAPGKVILSCAEDEMHTLPLWALAAALSERGVEALVLGPRVPSDALRQAVRRVGPAGILIWAQMPESAAAQDVSGMLDMRPAPVLLVAGPGWDNTRPEGAAIVDSLPEAIESLARAAGA